MRIRYLLGFLWFAFSDASVADATQSELRVAVASNFLSTAQKIADQYQLDTNQKVVLIAGSTGKLYAQIKNGAPYDVFLAADEQSVKKLVESEVVELETITSYAIGELLLWSREPLTIEQLSNYSPTRIALANPKLAPYGKAAEQVMDALGLLESWQSSLVLGSNINQVAQFVFTDSVDLAFVAKSQKNVFKTGYLLNLPAQSYSPIRQLGAVVSDNERGKAFLSFMTSAKAKRLIAASGYTAP
ncbi:MAG: molybdate ABC transporter substrate-binding protein [Pseudomonadota bacterium]